MKLNIIELFFDEWMDKILFLQLNKTLARIFMCCVLMTLFAKSGAPDLE